ncbi:ArsI/CadI family heavy metal resistance metalloenzyme [Brevibacillus dissolubilis]|uniref:ArsI/CadI family heavy metal resistance metalloenzyme n=1 Tax=Brevibacillus dissolubilis TaxID=1844116 RepID=UPI001115D624|nr:ArsI/CadI family heavy metal resistance metalloenzyme [Brevibacillus dissolubilis]
MKMHVAINVNNLEASLDFYRKLFNAEPTKVKEDYAKFELDEPGLHFALNVRPYQQGSGVINHFGFQVKDTEAVLATKKRLREAGLVSLDEMNTTCCYAVQDKIWVRDPEGNPWEIFYTKANSEFESADQAAFSDVCCSAPADDTAKTTSGSCSC